MESEKINLGDSYCILSRYGQKFNLNQVLNNEIDILTSKKRIKLEEDGYDVNTYDEKYDKLNEELINKIKFADNITEREKITLEYNKKKNMLAKEYLDIDLQLKVSVN